MVTKVTPRSRASRGRSPPGALGPGGQCPRLPSMLVPGGGSRGCGRTGAFFSPSRSNIAVVSDRICTKEQLHRPCTELSPNPILFGKLKCP